MPTVQKRNDAMMQLNQADLLRVQDRNFAAQWYDATGGQSFSFGTAAFTVNLDTEQLNTAPTVYSMASDILTITEAGVYLFTAQVTTQQSGGSSAAVNHIWLEQDPATGTFALVTAAQTYFTMAAIPSAAGSGFIHAMLRVGINYRYRLRLEQPYGSSTMITLAGCSRLTVVRQWKNG